MSDIILQFQIAEKETFHHKYEALTSTSLNPTNASFRLLPSSVRRILQSVIAKVGGELEHRCDLSLASVKFGGIFLTQIRVVSSTPSGLAVMIQVLGLSKVVRSS